MEKIPSGVIGLDDLLYGGLPKGKSILITGNCGTGKTLVGAHFINEGFKRGEKGVFITFEQTREKLIEDVGEVNIDFKTMLKKNKLAILGGPVGKVNFFKLKTKASAEDMVKEISEVVSELKATRLVLDSINLFNILFETEHEKRDAMTLLSSTLDSLGCTSLLISEVPENSNQLSWYGFEDFVVDGVIRLSRRIDKNRCIRTINVVKMRGSKIIPDVRLMEINDNGVIFHPDKVPSQESLF